MHDVYVVRVFGHVRSLKREREQCTVYHSLNTSINVSMPG